MSGGLYQYFGGSFLDEKIIRPNRLNSGKLAINQDFRFGLFAGGNGLYFFAYAFSYLGQAFCSFFRQLYNFINMVGKTFLGLGVTGYLEYRIDTINLSYRQVHAGNRSSIQIRLSTNSEKHQRNTSYNHQIRLAELRILFSSLFGNPVRTSRSKSGIGEN